MKKIIALLLSVVMLMTVAACDSGKDGQVSSEKTSSASSVQPSSIEDASSTTTSVEEPDTFSSTALVDSKPALSAASKAPSKAPSNQPLSTPSTMLTVSGTKEPTAKFTIGNIQNNTYYNPYVGIKIKISDNWECMSDEEIANLNGNKSTNTLKNESSVLCFFASSSDKELTVLLEYENMLKTYGKRLYPDEFIEVFLPKYCADLEAAGVFIMEVEHEKMYVGGKYRTAAILRYSVYGVYTEQYVVLLPRTDHMGVLSVAAVHGNNLDSAILRITEHL